MKTKTIKLIAAIGLLFPFSLAADEGSGILNGTVGIGGIVIDSANNLNPNGSKKRLESLQSAPDRETTGIAIILPRATWDIGEKGGTKLYFETEPPIDEVGGFAFTLGATNTIAGVGILDTAAFFTPFEEAWEDPYATGVDRNETDTSKYGATIGLNRIMGSGLRVRLVYMNDDVDNDIIGSTTPELSRDGGVYSLNVNYSYYLSKTVEIRPRVSIRRGDYDGDANSFIKYKIELETRLILGKVMLIPRAYYSYSEYDEVHPIFNKTRETDGYGISLMTNYMAPFNLPDWSVMGLLSYSRGESTINFYDTEAFTVGGFLNYHF